MSAARTAARAFSALRTRSHPSSHWTSLPRVTSRCYSKPSSDSDSTSLSDIQSLYSGLRPDDLLESGHPDYVKLILTSRVYDVIDETPVTYAVSLSHLTGSTVMLKREDLQPVFSFKLRGAYNMMAKLPAELRAKGVVACSAGNHAQGVAYSAKHLGARATIVMPVATPSIKYQNVSRLGSQVVLYGDDFDTAKVECARLAEEHGWTNIPPFDHPYVIAGQGTIALELLRQVNAEKLGAIFCPIGGGGLATGIAAYVKRLAPHVKVIGVETYDAAGMYESLKAGKPVELKDVGLFAEGTAVKIPGIETFRLSQKYLDEIIRVSTDEICAAIKDVFQDTRAVVEPSGAMGVAALKKYVEQHPEEDHSTKTYVPILSGANMNFDRMRFVSERARLGEGKEVFMSVRIPEKPGTFERLHSIIYPRDVTEFCYRFSPHQGRVEADGESSGDAYVYTSFSVRDRKKELAQVMTELQENGFEGEDISDNEMAKSHGRYMVGGRAEVPNERLLSFSFPEKPGALSKFLKGIGSTWNITLFHYRNQGSDISKVLAGVSVPPEDSEKFDAFLQNLGYKFEEETNNSVYKHFLSN